MFNTYLKRNFNVLSKDHQKDVENIRNQKRFIPFSDRPQYSNLQIDSFLLSQGVKDCMTWRGIAVGKSVYDFALYPMIIWENRPATILEIGSGEGASAIWMADLCKSYNLPTQVYSMDIEPPDIEHKNVTFIEGDSKQISNFSTKNLHHPWIIIEDSWGKKGSNLEVLNTLYVDAYYCDYFGVNATSAMNTILRKN